jgi:hypothetical protein
MGRWHLTVLVCAVSLLTLAASFVEGMMRQGDRLLFYYGRADKYIGAAQAPIAQ